MILPDGYSDVPAGKIAAVVTHLEMTARPALSLRSAGRMDAAPGRDAPTSPGIAISIAASARSGCGSRASAMADAEAGGAAALAAGRSLCAGSMTAATKACSNSISASPDQCEIGMFGVTAKLVGTGAGALADEPRAGACVVAADQARSGCTPAPSIIRPRCRSTSARAFARSGGRSRWRMIRGSTAPRRAMWRSMCRLLSEAYAALRCHHRACPVIHVLVGDPVFQSTLR